MLGPLETPAVRAIPEQQGLTELPVRWAPQEAARPLATQGTPGALVRMVTPEAQGPLGPELHPGRQGTPGALVQVVIPAPMDHLVLVPPPEPQGTPEAPPRQPTQTRPL